MPDPVFERYKEQLRAGHVAAIRGQLPRALEHYRQASELADARPLPHTCMGQVLLRLDRTDEALAAFSRALGRAPHDEGALTGRAAALAAAHRGPEAAEILERLAEVQASSDRAPEALATLERALAFAVTKRRQRRADELAAQLGVTRTTIATAEAASAELVESGVVPWEPAEGVADAGGMDPGSMDPGGMDEASPEPPAPAADPSARLDADHVLHIQAAPAPQPIGPADLLAASDPEAFVDDAEQARDTGQTREAVALYVLASDAYARAGAFDAALDVCQRAMEVSVDAPSIHLALARLYLARGWRERAIEKLTLLDRLLSFGPASGARRQIAALAASQAMGDPRLLALATPAPAQPPAGEVAPASV